MIYEDATLFLQSVSFLQRPSFRAVGNGEVLRLGGHLAEGYEVYRQELRRAASIARGQ